MIAGRIPARTCAACTEAQKREYGCTEDTEHQEHWITIEGEVIKRCPASLVGPVALRVVQYGALIESGVLPDAGGWLDQAATYTDAALIAHAAWLEFSREKSDGRR